MNIYLRLLKSMFLVGLFSVGGGYVALPLIQEQIVTLNGWLTTTEFADVITIAEMTPGPIAINAATFVGIRVGGFPGAIVATLGCILPSFFIVLTLAKLYYKYRSLDSVQDALSGLRPATIALIASAGLSIIMLAFFGGGNLPADIADTNFTAVAIFVASMISLKKFKTNPLLVIGTAGFIGLLVYGGF